MLLAMAAWPMCAQLGHAGSPPTTADEGVLRRVDEHYNHLRSLRTHFSETYDGMGMHRVEAGTLSLSKPGKMRWSYADPAGKVFVLDGRYAWSYAPGDAQAQRIPAKQMEDARSPLRFLLGHTQLQRELTDVSVRPEAGGWIIMGEPKTAGAGFSQLTLHVTQGARIEGLAMRGIDGATTTFTFRDTEENVPIGSAEFVFTPPIGVPIVDGLPPI